MRPWARALFALVLFAQAGAAAGPLASSLLPGQPLSEIRVLGDGGVQLLRYPAHIAFRGHELIVVEGGQHQFADPFNGNRAGRILSLGLQAAFATPTTLAAELADPMALAVRSGGEIWFSQYGSVGRLTADGLVEVRSEGYPPFGFDATYLPGSDENVLQEALVASGQGDLRDMDTTGTLGLAFAPDGALYGTQAVNGRPPDDPLLGERGYAVPLSSSVLAIRDGPPGEEDVVAGGCRNCFALAFAPATSPYAGRLFATENTDPYRARLQNGPHRSALDGGAAADAGVMDALVEVLPEQGVVRRVATLPPITPTLGAVPTGLAFAPPEFNARLAGLPVVALFGATVFGRQFPGAVVAVVPDEVGGVGTVIPIAQGLDAPTGLAFGPDGALYVAEYGGRLYRIAPAR